MDPTTDQTTSSQNNWLVSQIVAGAQRFANILPRIKMTPQPQNTNQNYGTPDTKKYGNLSTSIKNIGTITTPFWGNTRSEQFHPWIDVANKIGTPIPSFSQWVVSSVEHNKTGFWNSIIVTDPSGNKIRYSHLYKTYVNPWDKVNSWEEIAQMWNTGNVYSTSGGTGSHLDLRIVNRYKQYVNPFTYLNQKS